MKDEQQIFNPLDIPYVIEGDDGLRDQKDRCFYCRQKIGARHKEDCVVVTKEVILEFSIEVPVRVPYSWDENDINFHRTQSSSCADNSLRDILQFIKENRKKGLCLCGILEARYIRTSDPTPRIPENEEFLKMKNSKL